MANQRIAKPGVLYDRAFEGRGASLYATTDSSISYRRPRIAGGIPVRGTGKDSYFQFNATTRVASVSYPTEQFVYSLPSSFASSTARFDVRHFKDDVENQADNYRTAVVKLDSNRDPVNEILGTATLLDQEQRDGGVVRLRFSWVPALNGVQPDTFTAIRTAGPTSPANAAVSYSSTRQRVVEIDTPALDDGSAYTYKIEAKKGSTTKDVLTGISVQADATGPPAPISPDVSAI